MTSVLFENSTVVTLDDSNSVFDTGWVFVKDGIIENLASLDIDLSGEQESLAAMECGYISGWDPTSEA